MTEEEFERELEVYSHLKKKLIMMYQDIFKEDLEPSDRIDVPSVKIPLKPNQGANPYSQIPGEGSTEGVGQAHQIRGSRRS